MKNCSVKGCEERSKARGYCWKHYKRWQDHGNASSKVDERTMLHGAECSVQDCSQPFHAKGYCVKHYSRIRSHGDATICNRHFWKDDIHKNLYHNAKYRAKVDGLVFTILPEDIIVPEFCPILGLKLQVAHGYNQTDCSPSLDRIINECGYIKGNIQVISLLANRIKNNASKEQIKKVADYLYALESKNA